MAERARVPISGKSLTVQTPLSHREASRKMIRTHVLNRGPAGVPSPADRPSALSDATRRLRRARTPSARRPAIRGRRSRLILPSDDQLHRASIQQRALRHRFSLGPSNSRWRGRFAPRHRGRRIGIRLTGVASRRPSRGRSGRAAPRASSCSSRRSSAAPVSRRRFYATD